MARSTAPSLQRAGDSPRKPGSIGQGRERKVYIPRLYAICALELRPERHMKQNADYFGAALRRPFAAGDGRHAKADCLHLEAGVAKADGDGLRQHRELVGPHAGGDAQGEDPALERDRPRSIGHPQADDFYPNLLRDGRRIA